MIRATCERVADLLRDFQESCLIVLLISSEEEEREPDRESFNLKSLIFAPRCTLTSADPKFPEGL